MPTNRALKRLEIHLEELKSPSTSRLTTVTPLPDVQPNLSQHRSQHGHPWSRPHDFDIILEPATVYDSVARDSTGFYEFIKQYINLYDDVDFLGLDEEPEETTMKYNDKFGSMFPWYWGNRLAILVKERRLVVNLADFVLGKSEPVCWSMQPVTAAVRWAQMDEAMFIVIDNCPGPAKTHSMAGAADAAYVATMRCRDYGMDGNLTLNEAGDSKTPASDKTTTPSTWECSI